MDRVGRSGAPSGTTRRSVVIGGTAAAIGVAAWTRPAPLGPIPSALRGDALFADVVRYDAFGVHRTATPADHATVRWMGEHLGRYGFHAQAQRFTVRQFFPGAVALSAGGRGFAAHPQWPVAAPEVRIELPLRPLDRPGAPGRWLALVELLYDPRARIDLPACWTLLERAREAGAAAMVATTAGRTGGLIVLNAPRDGRQLPLPVMLTRGDASPALARVAAEGGTAAISWSGRIEPTAPAFNMLGTRGTRGAWMVVSTPVSAWTHAAGERGCGVALWRAMAASAHLFGDRRVLMLATSGHELGHSGAAAIMPLVRRTTAEHGVACWLHLGANAATRDVAPGPPDRARGGRRLMASAPLLPALGWCFAGVRGTTPLPLLPGLAAGELATLAKHGFGPIAGVFGPAPTHHSADDRPHVTSPALLAEIGAPLFRFLLDQAA